MPIADPVECDQYMHVHVITAIVNNYYSKHMHNLNLMLQLQLPKVISGN